MINNSERPTHPFAASFVEIKGENQSNIVQIFGSRVFSVKLLINALGSYKGLKTPTSSSTKQTSQHHRMLGGMLAALSFSGFQWGTEPVIFN